MRKAGIKLSGHERRAAIIKAVGRVFAAKGFHGTTTRELAQAAGVSEALLFKHFPHKQALYAAMQQSCCREQAEGLIARLKTHPPGAATLVLLVHMIVALLLAPHMAGDDEEVLRTRLIVRSVTEDGEFARLFLKGTPAELNRLIGTCLKAAITAGDAAGGTLRPGLAGWFALHLAGMLKLHMLPAKPVIDYRISREKLIEQTVHFLLRGMGLKDEAIQRYYDGKVRAFAWTDEPAVRVGKI